MIRVAKLAAVALISLAVIAIGSPLLFWLSRTQVPVAEPDPIGDDPGLDVDGDS